MDNIGSQKLKGKRNVSRVVDAFFFFCSRDLSVLHTAVDYYSNVLIFGISLTAGLSQTLLGPSHLCSSTRIVLLPNYCCRTSRDSITAVSGIQENQEFHISATYQLYSRGARRGPQQASYVLREARRDTRWWRSRCQLSHVVE